MFSNHIQAEEINLKCNNVFPDVGNDSIFCPYIEYMYHQEITDGKKDGSFDPKAEITRGALAKFIRRAFDIPIDISGEKFSDVKSDNIFFEDVMTLKNAGIISGQKKNFSLTNL